MCNSPVHSTGCNWVLLKHSLEYNLSGAVNPGQQQAIILTVIYTLATSPGEDGTSQVTNGRRVNKRKPKSYGHFFHQVLARSRWVSLQ
jgi:hypothetical protein